MVLTIRGKAADSGAEGDVISVLNEQSKRTVQGTIIGPGRVAGQQRFAAVRRQQRTGAEAGCRANDQILTRRRYAYVSSDAVHKLSQILCINQ